MRGPGAASRERRAGRATGAIHFIQSGRDGISRALYVTAKGRRVVVVRVCVKKRREYESLDAEFSLASAPIEARTRAGLTQAEVARRMKTTQAAVARLESGGSRPSTRTLQRYAAATGSRLRISFEPQSQRR